MADLFLDLPQLAAADRRARARPQGRTRRSSREERRSARGDSRRASTRFNQDWRELDRADRRSNFGGSRSSASPRTRSTTGASSTSTISPGSRMEFAPVFDAYAPRASSACSRIGEIDGLRIDHIDGLFDPEGISARAARRVLDRPFYLVVEKILAPHERLRDDWPVDGTTGYDYLNLSLGAPDRSRRRRRPSTSIYRAFTGDERRVRRDRARLQARIMDNEMASELQRARPRRGAARPAKPDDGGSHPRAACSARSRQIVACFPVYRTYVDLSRRGRPKPTGATSRGRSRTRAGSIRRSTPSAFDFLESVCWPGRSSSRPRASSAGPRRCVSP